MTKILYTNAPPGAGKSWYIREQTLTCAGKHLIAVPTGALMDDYLHEFHAQAAAIGLPQPPTIRFHSSDADPGQTVTSMIAAAVKRQLDAPHIIFLITHDALRGSIDHGQFRDWQLWIDEALSLRQHEVRNTPTAWPILAQLYDLEPVEGAASLRRIVPGIGLRAKMKAAVAAHYIDEHAAGVIDDIVAAHALNPVGLATTTIRNDDVLKSIGDLHYRVVYGQDAVIANVTDWAVLGDGDGWIAFSKFDVHRLGAFRAVRMFANAITQTLCFKMLAADPTVQLVAAPIVPRSWSARAINIRYFAVHHQLSASALSKFAGPNLPLIAAWVVEQPWFDADRHFWMTNRDRAGGLHLPGAEVSPKSHGLNHLQNRTSVTMLFKSKPSHIERAMHRLHGIDEGSVIHEQEFEVLAQVASRGTVRRPSDTTPYNITIYDEHQAEALSKFFEESYGFRPNVEHVDLPGFVDQYLDRKPGPRKAILTDRQRADQVAANRRKDRDRTRLRRALSRLADGADPRQALPPELALLWFRRQLQAGPQGAAK